MILQIQAIKILILKVPIPLKIIRIMIPIIKMDQMILTIAIKQGRIVTIILISFFKEIILIDT